MIATALVPIITNPTSQTQYHILASHSRVTFSRHIPNISWLLTSRQNWKPPLLETWGPYSLRYVDSLVSLWSVWNRPIRWMDCRMNGAGADCMGPPIHSTAYWATWDSARISNYMIHLINIESLLISIACRLWGSHAVMENRWCDFSFCGVTFQSFVEQTGPYLSCSLKSCRVRHGPSHSSISYLANGTGSSGEWPVERLF